MPSAEQDANLLPVGQNRMSITFCARACARPEGGESERQTERDRMAVCVCVCVREREREREGGRESVHEYVLVF